MMSFVVTTFHRPEWLAVCLASIPSECEVIVVDDAIRHEGYARARLRGLAQVTTPYVAFLDDDDVLLPNWLEDHQIDADVVAGSYLETDENLRPLRTTILPPATLDNFRFDACPVNDGALIRREVLERITWHPERDTAMMFSAWRDLLVAGATFAATARPTWLHRLHADNMSARLDERDTAWRSLAYA